MIKIPGNLTIPKIQKLYYDLSLNNNSVVDVQLPKRIEKLDFGVFFSFLQFLATWIRKENSGKLCLPINSIEEAIHYLNDNEFVYPSIVLSWEKDIVDNNGNNIKKHLKTPSKQYYERMDYFELKGTSVPLYCFDHDKSDRGLSKHFYKNNRELVSEDVLGFNLYRAFQKIGFHNPSVFRKSIKESLNSFTSIIHELFSNTHEHAKTNELGFNLYPNIRALQLKFHKKPIVKYIETYNNFNGLSDYFKSDFKVNESGDLYLIEISILDSGPGLVKRYKGVSTYNMSINEEVDIIKKCLYRHTTSTSSFRAETKGIGLDRVLQTIDGRGFVRIKSGRVDIFRDMKSKRYFHHDNASDIQIYDWQTNSDVNFTVFPPAEGTLISIFFPLDYQ
ncbi:hypothetical protein LX87_05474 [Larkinella arboricola]|uniref:ATP-binding protein n=1 Tax=Larkinella arboricola TaxID=643671 RepID=A0A327WLH3_LARAB|nr:hypothetical protein [Larkinella arboricola]RAJ90845.1 hypothetical protein LX87_05474 [Larkinella arboricola]